MIARMKACRPPCWSKAAGAASRIFHRLCLLPNSFGFSQDVLPSLLNIL